MFDLNNHLYNLQLGALSSQDVQPNRHARQAKLAHKLFKEAVWRGQLYRLGAALLRRPKLLLDLESLKQQLRPGSAHYCGLKAVPLRQIIGSEGRSRDFDFAFHPVVERLEERWMSVAAAYLSATPLPPVELIQIGEAYFVRDGHHRVSVARALQREFIDAEIIAWSLQQADSLAWVHIPLLA